MFNGLWENIEFIASGQANHHKRIDEGNRNNMVQTRSHHLRVRYDKLA